MREDYIKLALLNAIGTDEFSNKTLSWLPIEDLDGVFQGALSALFQSLDLEIGNKYDEVVKKIVEDFVFSGIVDVEGDEFTGKYFRVIDASRIIYTSTFKANNEIAVRVSRLGGDAFLNALLNIARADGIEVNRTEDSASDELLENYLNNEGVPASDRTVSLSHNEMTQFDEQSSEIIEAVERLNGIDGELGVREILIGQLKAGRELIRAGCFKIYALQWTLIEGLKFLAARYEKETVGALAAILLAALSKQLELG